MTLPIATIPTPPPIAATADIAALADRVRAAPWVALDTEFMREQTYYARLCLIQLATPDEIALVDPLAADISPLLDALYAPGVCKVLHSARQDLELFYDLRAAVPENIFDTQIAVAFLGYDDQVGYATLVQKMCEVTLDKTQTRTNWALRPLSAEQLRYAADDVRYLRTMYPQILAALEARGRRAWVEAECARLSEPALYANDLATIHLRLKQGHAFPPRVQHALRALLVWREETARAEDLPRSWVLRDADLIALAQRPPATAADLRNGATLPAIARRAEAIVAALAPVASPAAAATPLLAEPVWPAQLRLTESQAKTLSRLSAIVRARAQASGIAAPLLAARKELERLLLGERELPVLEGWRREVVGSALLDELTPPS